MNKHEYLDFCRGIAGVVVDQPFDEDFNTYIARHADTRKWFAAVLEHRGVEMVNLKCDPIESEFLQSVYDGVRPGYHMNKTHWISVLFQSDVPDELFRQLTMASFRLTDKKRKKNAAKEEKHGKSEK